MLPEVVDCAGELGVATADILGARCRARMAGDQQRRRFGQLREARMIKATYAPAASPSSIPAASPCNSRNRLLTTIAYQLDGQRTYALEGSKSSSPARPCSAA